MYVRNELGTLELSPRNDVFFSNTSYMSQRNPIEEEGEEIRVEDHENVLDISMNSELGNRRVLDLGGVLRQVKREFE